MPRGLLLGLSGGAVGHHTLVSWGLRCARTRPLARKDRTGVEEGAGDIRRSG